MTNSSSKLFFRISAVLWLIWGAVHILAGVLTVVQATPEAVMGIADAANPDILTAVYPEAAGAIINQHGFNLFWVGLVTFIGGFYIWRQNRTAVLGTALVGGLTDVGYFIFMDIGGFVNFAPGTVMTIICLTAIILSFLATFSAKKKQENK